MRERERERENLMSIITMNHLSFHQNGARLVLGYAMMLGSQSLPVSIGRKVSPHSLPSLPSLSL